MARLSPARSAIPWCLLPVDNKLHLLYRGKVRDTYEIDEHKMLVVSSDGISIFDFVLDALIPEKGMILNAMSHFWFTLLECRGIKTHLIAAGVGIDSYLPAELRGNQDLQSRAMVVKRLRMQPIEFIARGYLTGSAFTEYKKGGTVSGHLLPEGLQDGDKLPRVLDTPTTKAEEGHDELLVAETVRQRYPRETGKLFEIFHIIASHAHTKGILFADTKMEFGRDRFGEVILADEVATPDSSRWWDRRTWLKSRTMAVPVAPPPLDKQLVRAFGIAQGVHRLDPLHADHEARVHCLTLPDELIRATIQTYRYIFWRLCSMTVEAYFHDKLGVALPRRKKRVALVFGSESDIESVAGVLSLMEHDMFLQELQGKPQVHIISCHRNPAELEAFAASGCEGADVVVAAGGKAFALPGVLDALLASKGKEIPVIGVALGEPNTRAFAAARLSIEELPGEPVIMDEVNERAYTGKEGLKMALERIAFGELPPRRVRSKKPAQLHIDLPMK